MSSELPLKADIAQHGRHVSKVPISEVTYLSIKKGKPFILEYRAAVVVSSTPASRFAAKAIKEG
jgi:hypothetical protein